MRWKNLASTAEYIARIAAGEDVRLERRERPVDEQIGDALFTGLRLTSGLDFEQVGTRYGVDLWGRYREALQPLAAAGRLTIEDQRLRLTRDGMLVANDIMQLFV